MLKDIFVAFVRTLMFIVVFTFYASMLIGLVYIGISVYNKDREKIEWNGKLDE